MPIEDELPLQPGEPTAGGEEAAWADVLARWGDDAAHRAYLDRFSDLDGFALAGRRYREALAARPADAVAARFRDEVVKRAMVQGLASLPRTRRPEQQHRRAKRVLLVLAATALGSALATAIFRLASGWAR